MRTSTLKIFLLLAITSAISGCASYQKFKHLSEEVEIPSKIFNANYNQTWQAVSKVMRRFDIEKQSTQAGIVKTRWINNTTELNFTDASGPGEGVKSAKFRLTINVVKGFRSSREVTKVTVFKRQLVEQDFLQGWKEVPTDGIQEKTILYRIGRAIAIDKKLQKIDRQRQKEEEKDLF